MDTVYKTTCMHSLKSCKVCTVPKLFCIRSHFKNSTLCVNEHTFFNCVVYQFHSERGCKCMHPLHLNKPEWIVNKSPVLMHSVSPYHA